jgi:hypothetical protein
MRHVIILFLSAFHLLPIQLQEVKQVEFSKISRGYEEHIRINADSLHVLIHDIKREKPAISFSRETEKEEWINICQSLKDVKIKSLESLPAPSMNRASDAAMHGTLSVQLGDAVYTHGFDDENPNDALKPLMKIVRGVSGRKETR